MEFALHTQRLTLRPFRNEDAPALFAILSEPNIMQSVPPFSCHAHLAAAAVLAYTGAQ